MQQLSGGFSFPLSPIVCLKEDSEGGFHCGVFSVLLLKSLPYNKKCLDATVVVLNIYTEKNETTWNKQ